MGDGMDGTDGGGVYAAKLLGWCDYLDDGGLDRPIDAIPYELMRCHDDEMADVVGVLLAVAATEGTDGARAIAVAAAGGPAADVGLEMDDQSMAQLVVLVTLLSLWAEGIAAPTEPHMTLRKAIVTSEGLWRTADAAGGQG